ncbi:MAG: nitroreductase family protein [Fidelibacterota bacterium]
MILRATELGLGTCWIGWIDKGEVKKLLKIPERIDVVSLITLGYPDDGSKGKKKRLKLERIISFNRYT